MTVKITKDVINVVKSMSDNQTIIAICDELLQRVDRDSDYKLTYYHKVSDYLMDHPEITKAIDFKGVFLVRFIAKACTEQNSEVVRFNLSEFTEPLHLNPAYLGPMSKLLKICKEHGIIKHIGHGGKSGEFSLNIPGVKFEDYKR